MYHNFLVKYLPAAPTNNCPSNLKNLTDEAQNPDSYITFTANMGFDFALELSNYIAGYQHDKNPTFLFRIICLLHEHRIYPPEFVMNELFDVFKEWLNTNGTKNIGSLFGTNKKGQGNRIIRENEFLIVHKLMQEIWQLKNAFKLATLRAAEMVSARLEKVSENSKAPCRYTVETLVKYYDGEQGASWRQQKTFFEIPCFDKQNNRFASKEIPMFEEWTSETRAEVSHYPVEEWTTEVKSKVLSQYPKYSIPYELK